LGATAWIADATERAYRRSDLLAKRGKLMQAWASNCETNPKVATGKVLDLRRA
jgi:hypothetical protein